MKTIIRLFFLLNVMVTFAQAPTISAHESLCINETPPVIIEGDVEYDSYQWYAMITYEEDPVYLPIENATSRNLEVNLDYIGYMVKVVVTKDGETYESNELYLQEMINSGILMQITHEDPNYYQDENGGNMCYGYNLRLEILNQWSHRVLWLKDGEIINGENTPVFYTQESGSYNALCATELCPNDFYYSMPSTITFHDCNLSTNDTKNENSINIYPNPSSDYIYINGFKRFEIKSYDIYNTKGQIVKSKVINDIKNPIDISLLEKGNYFLKLNGDKKSTSVKFIKK